MANPTRYNFAVYQGDDMSFFVTYKEGPVGSEVGKTLAGGTIASQIKALDKTGAAVATLTCTADADQVTNPGKMEVALTDINSALLTGTSYSYDIEVTWADGLVQTILDGTISVTKDVTQ